MMAVVLGWSELRLFSGYVFIPPSIIMSILRPKGPRNVLDIDTRGCSFNCR
jgi:hypothetical protein